VCQGKPAIFFPFSPSRFAPGNDCVNKEKKKKKKVWVRRRRRNGDEDEDAR
jgi:hypothetical protein